MTDERKFLQRAVVFGRRANGGDLQIHEILYEDETPTGVIKRWFRGPDTPEYGKREFLVAAVPSDPSPSVFAAVSPSEVFEDFFEALAAAEKRRDTASAGH